VQQNIDGYAIIDYAFQTPIATSNYIDFLLRVSVSVKVTNLLWLTMILGLQASGLAKLRFHAQSCLGSCLLINL